MPKYNGKIEPKRRIYNSLRNFIGENKVYKAGDTLCISIKDNGEYGLFIEADGESTFQELMKNYNGGSGEGSGTQIEFVEQVPMNANPNVVYAVFEKENQ